MSFNSKLYNITKHFGSLSSLNQYNFIGHTLRMKLVTYSCRSFLLRRKTSHSSFLTNSVLHIHRPTSTGQRTKMYIYEEWRPKPKSCQSATKQYSLCSTNVNSICLLHQLHLYSHFL